MQPISPESPEARRKRLAKARAKLGKRLDRVRPGTRPYEVGKRVVVGVYSDGFIHAGNLAFMALLAFFPFVIVASAIARLFGRTQDGLNTIYAVLQTMPPNVAAALEQPIMDVLEARVGPLLWFGAIVGLWTTGSFIETVRDVLRRAYGVQYGRPFYEYRLMSILIIIGSVIMAMVAFSMTIVLSGVQRFMIDLIPGADDVVGIVTLLRVVPALALFGALYLLFYSLTPKRYRTSDCPKWPGAAFVTIWWVATTALLPVALGMLGGYDLTYGSLAGVMIALMFFFIIGLGFVIGAELNAALAETPTTPVQTESTEKEDEESE